MEALAADAGAARGTGARWVARSGPWAGRSTLGLRVWASRDLARGAARPVARWRHRGNGGRATCPGERRTKDGRPHFLPKPSGSRSSNHGAFAWFSSALSSSRIARRSVTRCGIVWSSAVAMARVRRSMAAWRAPTRPSGLPDDCPTGTSTRSISSDLGSSMPRICRISGFA
jgi:hypothetical protein